MAIAALATSYPDEAQAHAFLVRTSPQQGERIDAGPASIKLQFSEPVVESEAKLSLLTSAGDEIEAGPPRLAEEGRVVATDLPPLQDGVYVVSWRVLAFDDHVTFGELAFAVGTSGEIPQTSSQTSGESPLPQAAARWTFLTGLFLAFGGLASERIIWTPVARRNGISVPAAPAGAALALALLGAEAQLLLSGEALEPVLTG